MRQLLTLGERIEWHFEHLIQFDFPRRIRSTIALTITPTL